MSDMMKIFVQQELNDQIKNNYPHMRYPSCMYARVVKSSNDGDAYTVTLKILDKNKQADMRFPEIPMVSTRIPVSAGDLVVVMLLYGECYPYIIGRCD